MSQTSQTSQTIQCISPIDGSLYVERPILSDEAANHVLRCARDSQTDWARRPLKERIGLVQKGVEQLGEMNDEILLELAWQMGRPVRYGGEFGGVKERADYMAHIAEEALAPILIEQSQRFNRYIRREPRGVTLVIAPWNYPFMTAINTIVPALIAGNSVILKHASQTPLVGERLVQAFHQAGIPEEVFQNIFVSHEQASRLIASGAFDLINFTGSVGGGRQIEKAAAGTFTPVNTELGGKDPAYVMEDADIAAAVATLMDGAMFNSGQCCCGIERIYVAEAFYEEFVERSVALVRQYQLGNPLDTETTIGPMAHARFADLVRNQTAEALASGARSLIDPADFPEDENAYLMPQILVDVDHSMRVMQEESFGPVVGIMKVESDQQAIALMNDSIYGLTASLWTQDLDRAETVGSAIETGTVFMNRCDYLDPALCWTGCKNTGNGAGLSLIGYHNLTRPKSFHLKTIETES